MAALVGVWLADDVEDRADVALDYDRYAAAEAALAWLNHEVTVTGPLNPGRWARVALASLPREAVGTLVGHAKVSVETPEGLAKGSVTAAGAAPTLDVAGPSTAALARAVFNLRVAWPPAVLDKACTEAIRAADEACETTSTAVAPPSAFQPSYPKPVHRLSPQGGRGHRRLDNLVPQRLTSGIAVELAGHRLPHPPALEPETPGEMERDDDVRKREQR